MVDLEWYKDCCEKHSGIWYYDTFKNYDKRDIDADGRRINLQIFWDDVIEEWEGHEFPSDFQFQNKWINVGNTYNRFAEPLDIAHYYSINDNGNYLSEGRPNCHKILQKWIEEKEKNHNSKGRRTRTKHASLSSDSCFWVHVEVT